MFNSALKKALIFQGLFFCSLALTQTIIIEKPRPDDPLESDQEFVIVVTGATPERVDFYLNGKLILARTEPPFRFQIQWNTRFKNLVKIVAYFGVGAPLVLEHEYREIEVDVEQKVQAVQCFPYLEGPLSGFRLRADGGNIEPQVFEPAGLKHPLNLVVALDVSGSMKFNLPALSGYFHKFREHFQADDLNLQLLTFDHKPRLITADQLPTDLTLLYKGLGKSVVWDALATACELFPQNRRRVILLISDGVDDGSKHDAKSVEVFFKRSEASLIWLSPLGNYDKILARLSRRSGGFFLSGEDGQPWKKLTLRLQNQHHLLAPGASYPIRLSVSPGKVWFPKWKK